MQVEMVIKIKRDDGTELVLSKKEAQQIYDELSFNNSQNSILLPQTIYHVHQQQLGNPYPLHYPTYTSPYSIGGTYC